MSNHGIRRGISTVDELVTFLRASDLEIDILMGIYDVLEQTFSRGYPNFIFEYQLEENNGLVNLKSKIEQCLPFGKEKTYNQDTYVFIKRVGDITILDGSILKFPVTYVKFKENIEFGGTKSRGETEIKTTFEVVFDSHNSLCYIQCGDRSYANAAYKVLQKYVTRIFKTFVPFSMSRMKRNTVIENEYSLDKQTIILLDYIQDRINEDGHEINDYLSVAFANKDRDKKVRSLRLNGNNLLDSYEVGDRVRLGDQIKSVRFQLRFQTQNDAIEMVNVSMDFQATIKIQYSNVQNTLNICHINRHLINKLTKSLTKKYKEQEVDANLQEIIARAKVRDSAFLHNVLSKIKKDISEFNDQTIKKTEVMDVINKYLLGE
jgi:hypothetical protein